MKIIADLHLHGRYSRACSKNLSVANLERYAKVKGLDLLGTADFTHPEWIKELKSNLKEDPSGFLKTEQGFNFILQTEISLIYTQGGMGRRVHHVVLAPSFEVVDKITEELKRFGRVDYDGRPIFKIPSNDFVRMMKNISPDIEVIPAHIWTPWFGMLGSKSGFNSLKECFREMSSEVHAIETGLSSDPEMNWRLTELDDKAIVSFSDSHSYWPHRIGRESTVFEIEPTYKSLIEAIRNNKVSETLEFWPHEGKYHYDGHRNCNVVMSPKEAIANNNICPVCKKPLTIGVLHRVEELADRKEGIRPPSAKPFRRLIPLAELISGLRKQNVSSKKTFAEYYKLIERFGDEFKILLETPEDMLTEYADDALSELIIRNRKEQIKLKPGYDGVYGIPVLEEKDNPSKDVIIQESSEGGIGSEKKQTSLSDF